MISSKDYYSTENALKFMSASQFKSFQNCEAQALAEIKGEFKRDFTSALAVGSYVDSFIEGTLEQFKAEHPEIFTLKGTLRSEYGQAEELCRRISKDEMFMKYLGGEHQKIFLGKIANVDFKGKLDAYHEGKCIVDLKTCKDFEPVWKNGHKMSFIEAWGYDIQGAIYQELVYQNTGKKLPFFICAVTKERTPNLEIISIPQERLDECLELVKINAPHYNDIKLGKIRPTKCSKCDYCKFIKKIENIIDYRDLNPELFREKPPQEPVSVSSIVSLPSIENAPSGENKTILEGKKSKKKKHKKNGKVVIIKL